MIKEFQGKYRWLSNFYLTTEPIKIKDRGFISVEHAYMSEKSFDESWKDLCQQVTNPGQIKRMSRNIQLRTDWEKVKLDIMWVCLVQKFHQEPFKTLLLETGNQFLQEGNRWGDTFWGVNLITGIGENHLGRLIMEIRDDLPRRK